jgi:hypothetical protein
MIDTPFAGYPRLSAQPGRAQGEGARRGKHGLSSSLSPLPPCPFEPLSVFMLCHIFLAPFLDISHKFLLHPYRRCRLSRFHRFLRSRRLALRSAIRRFSLLDMKNRFFFTSLRTRSRCTFLRKRLSKLSCDSPGFSITVANRLHLPLSRFVFSIVVGLEQKKGPALAAGYVAATP